MDVHKVKEKFLHEFSSFLFELNNNTNEWYLSDFIDVSIKPLSAMTSFELVSEVMSMIIDLNIHREDCFYDAIYILNELYQHANTTERPSFLVKNPNFFTKLVDQTHHQDTVELIKNTANQFHF